MLAALPSGRSGYAYNRTAHHSTTPPLHHSTTPPLHHSTAAVRVIMPPGRAAGLRRAIVPLE
jgi:hypothetical protein